MSLLIPFICYLTVKAEAAQIYSTSTMLLMACDNNFVSAKECKQLQHIQNKFLSFMGKHLLIIKD
jgi:hypothetical protein